MSKFKTQKVSLIERGYTGLLLKSFILFAATYCAWHLEPMVALLKEVGLDAKLAADIVNTSSALLFIWVIVSGGRDFVRVGRYLDNQLFGPGDLELFRPKEQNR